MASDATKVQGRLIPSFTDVLVKRRLPKTSATTAALDCNTSSCLPFSPHIAANTTITYHKMIRSPFTYLPKLLSLIGCYGDVNWFAATYLLEILDDETT